jgi:OmpA-OmpF porin, OOP family
MNPKSVRFLVFVVLAGFVISAPALSQQDTGWYAGLNIGQSKAKDACTGVFGPGVSCDEKDTAWNVFGGYQFNANFGAELGYVDLGEAKASFAGFGNATVEAKGFEVVGVGTWPIDQQFSVYGRLGFFRWDVDLNDGTGLVGSASESGTDLTYGFGVKYKFTRDVALRAGYQRYNDVGDANLTGQADVDVLYVGIVVKF